MEEFKFVLVNISILCDPDCVNLVILPTDQTHGTLDLKGAFHTEGDAFLFAECLQCIAVYAGVFGTDKHILRLCSGRPSPSNEFFEAGGIIGQMLGI